MNIQGSTERFEKKWRRKEALDMAIKALEQQPCEDTISRQAAIDALGYCQTYLFDSRDKDKKISLEDAEYAIEQLPSTQPERPKGKWNTYYHSDTEFTYSCNSCGYSAPYQVLGGEVVQKKWNFCPNCGADMRGGQDE